MNVTVALADKAGLRAAVDIFSSRLESLGDPAPDPQTYMHGGSHYLKLGIQPIEFAIRNGWDAGAFSILKYLTRWRDKDGIEGLQKALHFVDLRAKFIEDRRPDQAIVITMAQYVSSNEIPAMEIDTFMALEDLVSPRLDESPVIRERTADRLRQHICSLIRWVESNS